MYQTDILYSRLYRVSIIISKKYQPRYQQFLKRLHRTRIEARLTQIEVGENLKKLQVYISKIERGEQSVDSWSWYILKNFTLKN